MARAKTLNVVGLSIEPGRIAAAQVAVNGAITVERGARAELDLNVVRDGEVTDSEALAEALRDLWREHKDLDRRVRIGVANARIVVRTLDLPPIGDSKQLDNAVRFQAADEIPMPLDAAVLDYHSVGVVDTPDGPRQRVILVAARKDMIAAVLDSARAAGLKPEGIDLSAFGMVRALKRTQPVPGPELYVSVGGLTNLAITQGPLCAFTRVAGTGLEGIAIELAERRTLTLPHARMWLHHVGLRDDLAEIEGDPDIISDARTTLIEGTRRIAGEIRSSMDFHSAQTTDGTSMERLILTGPAVAVPGFAAALQAELGIEVEERVIGGHKGNVLDPLDAACLSVAAGLAVKEMAA